MTISSLVRHDVSTCHIRDSLEQVGAKMWTHDIGCLPVIGDDGRLVGMITDRDVAMAAFLQGAPLRSIAVSTAMAKELETAAVTDSVEDIIRRMAARQLRRIPVVNAAGILVGIVSLNDLAHAAAAGTLPLEAVGALLAAIGKPRPMQTATQSAA